MEPSQPPGLSAWVFWELDILFHFKSFPQRWAARCPRARSTGGWASPRWGSRRWPAPSATTASWLWARGPGCAAETVSGQAWPPCVEVRWWWCDEPGNNDDHHSEINCGSPGILPNGWLEGSKTTLHSVVTFRLAWMSLERIYGQLYLFFFADARRGWHSLGPATEPSVRRMVAGATQCPGAMVSDNTWNRVFLNKRPRPFMDGYCEIPCISDKCQIDDIVICFSSSVHRPLHLPWLHRGQGQRLHDRWADKVERDLGI